MSSPVQVPNKFDLIKTRFDTRLRSIQSALRDASETEIQSQVFAAYRDVLTHLREPEDVRAFLDEYQVRTASVLNEPFQKAHRNALLLIRTQETLGTAIRDGFSYLSALSDIVRHSVTSASSRTIDLKVVSGDLSNQTIVGGDDFRDNSLVDLEKTPVGTRAEIVPFGGGLILRRLSTNDVLEQIGRNISVDVAGPLDLYEGKRYGRLEPPEVDPEGDAFRFRVVSGSYSFVQTPGLSDELQSRFSALSSFFDKNTGQAQAAGVAGGLTADFGLARARSSGEFGGLSIDDWEQIAGNFHYEKSFIQDGATEQPNAFSDGASVDARNDDRTLTAFNSAITIVKGDSKQVAERRKRMFDDDLDTFWQAEVVTNTSQAFNTVRFDPASNGPVPQETLDSLAQAVEQRFDDRDLEVTVTLDLGAAQILNFFTIAPVYSSPSSFLEMVRIQWSFDGTSFEDISEALDGRFETRLTEDVNNELTASEAVLALSTSKYDLSGRGFFSFSPVEARFLRFSLRERTPSPLVYHALRVVLRRTITVTTKEKKFGHVKRRSTTQFFSKSIELDADQTLFLGVGDSSREDFLGEIEGSANTERGSGDFGSLTGVVAGNFLGGAAGLAAAIAASASSSFASSGVGRSIARVFGFSSRVRTEDSGWELQDILLIPKYDKARYSVGIRELGLFNYTYEETSQIVSKEFISPKSIRALSLEAHESIPTGLQTEGFSPVSYYVSLDNGNSWVEIAPSGRRPIRVTDGSRFVPQIIHVNTELPEDQRDPNHGFIDLEGPSRKARVKIVVRRAPDNNRLSPVVKGYRLKMITESLV